MAAVATAIQFPRICSLPTIHLSPSTLKKVTGTSNVAVGNPYSSSTLRIRRSFPARVPNSNRGDDSPTIDNINSSFSSEEDLNYYLKLGAGTFVGAAVIKYGSVLLPEITRPSIIQALIMIFAPVAIAIFLLIKQTRAEQ